MSFPSHDSLVLMSNVFPLFKWFMFRTVYGWLIPPERSIHCHLLLLSVLACSVWPLTRTFAASTLLAFYPLNTSGSAGHVRLVRAGGDRLYGEPHRYICCSSTGSRNGGSYVAGSPLPDLAGRPAPHRLHSHQGRPEATCCCFILSKKCVLK